MPSLSGCGCALPSGSTHFAETTPHMTLSVAFLQRPIAFAPSNASVPARSRPVSQSVVSLSAVPSQSSSMLLPGKSYAPLLMVTSHSLQSSFRA